MKNVIQLTGTGTAAEKREALRKLHDVPSEEPLVVVATGKYVGEGFDYPRLDTLFLALPISWKGLVAQYAGRLHRENEGKKDVRIYDYIDIHEPICDSMYRKRLKGYASIGYQTIQLGQPSLFEDFEDIPENQIFDGRTYYKSMSRDVANAKKSVVVSSPKLYRVVNNKLVGLLKELNAKGTVVSIITSKEDDQVQQLAFTGLHVSVKSGLSVCSVVIDRSVVWYGSVNVLGFSTEEDNVIKLQDANLASELLSVLLEK